MLKLFLKSFWAMFLWIILFINVIFVFNLVGQIPFTASNGIDYSNKYFGISTLIDFIKALDLERDFAFIGSLRGFITNLQNNINEYLGLDWNQLASAQVTDWDSFWSAVGQFFTLFGKSVAFVFVMMFCATCWVVYFAFYFLAFVYLFIKLISGQYFSVVPSVPSNNAILMLMSSIV